MKDATVSETPLNDFESEDSLALRFCKRQPVSIERGLGSHVWDTTGKCYLDFTSGWGVTCLGHASDVVVQALTEQAGRIMQNPNSGFTYSPARAGLLRELRHWLPEPLTRMYFVNSGAEANDMALKLARKLTGRNKVVSARGAFHGRTFTTLKVSVGEQAGLGFLPSLPHNHFVPFDDIEALRAVVNEQTAAVILEPVQGEGGVQIPSPDYLGAVQAHCQSRGALLIVDEIQTGFCRTGKRFALEYAQPVVQPDMLTMAKGIAGGFPFAAIAVSDAVAAGLHLGDHGGTYCGNPLGCAVASAVLRHLRVNQFEVRVNRQGTRLGAGLRELAGRFSQLVSGVRGQGLLWALQFGSDQQVQAVTAACLERGLLVTPTRNAVLRLLPPLTVTGEEIDQAMTLLEQALAAAVDDLEIGLDCSAEAHVVKVNRTGHDKKHAGDLCQTPNRRA